MPTEQLIPDAARRDEKSFELARVWVAERGLHCSLKIGVYSNQGIDEENAWGIVLADLARHVSNALASSQQSSDEILPRIVEKMLDELGYPTSSMRGGFSE